MLTQCWFNVGSASYMVDQHRVYNYIGPNKLTVAHHPENTSHIPNVGSMLAHYLRRWPNIETALVL